ncbi:hypothetical protein SAMN06272771_7518 [Streptomyces sp. Ag82_O1-12]|nr:hypothetical protein SAMN06272771_7518 [Streptomyces sp. Ag82_O1-12]SOD50014.1 hypothetical protein SAMN06272727_7525 [Streptomyces sp. Ag82_G6-1]
MPTEGNRLHFCSERAGLEKQPVPYEASNAGQEDAIEAGVGFFSLRTQASGAEIELAYSDVLSPLCSYSTNAVGSSIAWRVRTGTETFPVMSPS